MGSEREAPSPQSNYHQPAHHSGKGALWLSRALEPLHDSCEASWRYNTYWYVVCVSGIYLATGLITRPLPVASLTRQAS